jgi:hypothetical protein
VDVTGLILLQFDGSREGLDSLLEELEVSERNSEMVMDVCLVCTERFVLEGFVEVTDTALVSKIWEALLLLVFIVC